MSTYTPKTYETLATAAERWGVNERTLRRAVAEQKLEAFRLGRVMRFDPAAVDSLFRSTLDHV